MRSKVYEEGWLGAHEIFITIITCFKMISTHVYINVHNSVLVDWDVMVTAVHFCALLYQTPMSLIHEGLHSNE